MANVEDKTVATPAQREPAWAKLALPVLVVLAVVAGLVAFGAWNMASRVGLAPANMLRLSVPDTTPSPFKGFAIRPERPAPDFTLTDSAGQPWRLADHRGEAVALFFGYTHCPDVCPQTMALMSQAADQLGVDADKLAVVFITVDPERDTPEVLSRYADAFNPSFVGLTGEMEEIQRVAAEFGVQYLKEIPPAAATRAAEIAAHDETGDGHEGTPGHSHDESSPAPASTEGRAPAKFKAGTGAYTVAHSGVVFLIDPQGQLRSSFLLPFDPADVVHDTRLVLDASQG
jgi:cytochrome oxidase Cu insertion factor (SCO1/SenC/PrrC family)